MRRFDRMIFVFIWKIMQKELVISCKTWDSYHYKATNAFTFSEVIYEYVFRHRKKILLSHWHCDTVWVCRSVCVCHHSLSLSHWSLWGSVTVEVWSVSLSVSLTTADWVWVTDTDSSATVSVYHCDTVTSEWHWQSQTQWHWQCQWQSITVTQSITSDNDSMQSVSAVNSSPLGPGLTPTRLQPISSSPINHIMCYAYGLMPADVLIRCRP